MSEQRTLSRLDEQELNRVFPVKEVTYPCAHFLIGKRPRPANHEKPCNGASTSELDHAVILKTPTGDVLLNQSYGDQSREWARSYADAYKLDYEAVTDVDGSINATIFWNPTNDLDTASVIAELRAAFGV